MSKGMRLGSACLSLRPRIVIKFAGLRKVPLDEASKGWAETGTLRVRWRRWRRRWRRAETAGLLQLCTDNHTQHAPEMHQHAPKVVHKSNLTNAMPQPRCVLNKVHAQALQCQPPPKVIHASLASVGNTYVHGPHEPKIKRRHSKKRGGGGRQPRLAPIGNTRPHHRVVSGRR